jgi:hypothetical protein
MFKFSRILGISPSIKEDHEILSIGHLAHTKFKVKTILCRPQTQIIPYTFSFFFFLERRVSHCVAQDGLNS